MFVDDVFSVTLGDIWLASFSTTGTRKGGEFMSLEKTVYMNQLFELYEGLLTPKQAEMLSLYYEEDYSLSEIAQYYDISRQGVHDNIKRGEAALEHYEAQLHLLAQRDKRWQHYQAMMTCDEIQSLKTHIQLLMDEEYDI